MALTRARVVSGPPALKSAVESAIRHVLTQKRDPAKIAADVRDMRERIEKEKGTTDIWDLKQVRGGLVDLEFITQYLQLVHAAERPEVLSQNTVEALANLEKAGYLPDAAADSLLPAARLYNNVTQVLRLCLDGPFQPAATSEGLKALLSRAGETPDFARLEAELATRQEEVQSIFKALVA
jgi:glutamate-ammonia-ligase adenylyltransferase